MESWHPLPKSRDKIIKEILSPILMKSYLFHGNKAIYRTDGNIVSSAKDLLDTDIFREIFRMYMDSLREKASPFLTLFDGSSDDDIIDLLKMLAVNKKEELPEYQSYFSDPYELRQYVEGLYNFWRQYERYIVCYSTKKDRYETIPYRTFTNTISVLNDLVRQAYRDISENIMGMQERVFRQVPAAFQIGIIAKENDHYVFSPPYDKLNMLPMIRQVFTEPPLIMDPPTNTRTGFFEEISENLLSKINLSKEEYLCYPVKAGELLIHVYFHVNFIDLGISMANLFDISNDEDLRRKPDAIYIYGVKDEDMTHLNNKTVYYDDKKEGMMIGFVPLSKEFGYFGYLKKMTLTLHNLLMMKKGRLPVHGAMVSILFRNGKRSNIIIIGDTGAGKSESLEAFRVVGDKYISDIRFIFDDMGSLEIDGNNVRAYGTETGAFVRLDDLSPEFAYGNLDRSIIMSPQKVNARAIIPITTMREVLYGYTVDVVLYANNYEAEGPLIEFFSNVKDAQAVFKAGKRMAKGTTSEIGMTESYYANPFGPHQRKDVHDKIADRFFSHFFKNGLKVGMLRTKLGIKGMETKGPEEAARALFETLMKG
jgi:hypothetical protein